MRGAMTAAEYRAAAAKPKASKYRNARTAIDGIKFASKKEAKRYAELKLRERAGEITQLRCHPRYELAIKGILICTYVADFAYVRLLPPARGGQWVVVEDVKSDATKTAVFVIKSKLMKAIHGIDIVII